MCLLVLFSAYGACGRRARAHTADNITKWTKETLEAIGLTAERLMGAAAE